VRASWRYYRGIALGIAAISRPERPWYRIRVGRDLAICTARGLPPEWLAAYLRWYENRGLRNEALALEAAARETMPKDLRISPAPSRLQ
jgi:hypothetical protein